MTSQPDKLFREKLENFQRPASVAAWERIESGLNKNQSKGLWLKFAAGVSVFAVGAFILWPANPTENQQHVSNTQQISPKIESIEKNTSEKITASKSNEQPAIHKTTAKNNIKKAEPVLTTESAQSTNESNVVSVIESIEASVAVAETKTNETDASRTIVYTADEVNAKFLKKKSPPEATAAEKKTSGMQKLMGLAYTIKNPDNGIGDLRQKKDEILALNFLSKEDKTNKEKN